MQTNKVLSIIVPTYNMEKYLHKCLSSLIVSDENMENLEVLVVNDGSKDSSSQIAHEYEAKYPQTFRVIDKENGNYGSCINRGLKDATGKYVKVLDADDSFNQFHFAAFVGFLKESDADMVISDYVLVDGDDNILKKKTFNMQPRLVQSLKMLPSNQIISMHAIAYKLQIIKDINYVQTEGVSYTDNEWTTIPVIYMQTAQYFPIPVYRYLVGRENQTIGGESLLRNRQQFILVNESILSDFSKTISFGEGTPYLLNRLCNILSVLYTIIIIQDYGKLNNELKEYDNHLKSCYPQYYHLLDNVYLGKLVQYHYIREWRKNDGHINYMYVYIHRYLSTVIQFLRSLYYSIKRS